jgi:hypothetical protein
VSNVYTLGALFERDLDSPAALHERRRHVADVVLDYLRVQTAPPATAKTRGARSKVEPPAR